MSILRIEILDIIGIEDINIEVVFVNVPRMCIEVNDLKEVIPRTNLGENFVLILYVNLKQAPDVEANSNVKVDISTKVI